MAQKLPWAFFVAAPCRTGPWAVCYMLCPAGPWAIASSCGMAHLYFVPCPLRPLCPFRPFHGSLHGLCTMCSAASLGCKKYFLWYIIQNIYTKKTKEAV